MPPRIAVLAVAALIATGCGATTPSASPTATVATTAAPATTAKVDTYADVCAREGGTQGYSTLLEVRVCELPDEILFRRDPADPIGFNQRCKDAGGVSEGQSGTRPCIREGLSWFTPHEWTDPATERYTFDD